MFGRKKIMKETWGKTRDTTCPCVRKNLCYGEDKEGRKDFEGGKRGMTAFLIDVRKTQTGGDFSTRGGIKQGEKRVFPKKSGPSFIRGEQRLHRPQKGERRWKGGGANFGMPVGKKTSNEKKRTAFNQTTGNFRQWRERKAFNKKTGGAMREEKN